MWWYLFQGSIVMAVSYSNIRWHWMPNPWVVSVTAGILAYFLTMVLSELLAGLRAQKAAKAIRREQQVRKEPIFDRRLRDMR